MVSKYITINIYDNGCSKYITKILIMNNLIFFFFQTINREKKYIYILIKHKYSFREL